MSAPLKVLLIAAATSTAGGGEKHVADLMRLLPDAGVDLGLVCPPGGDLPALAARLGIPFHCAHIGGGFSLAALAELRDAIRVFQPDIVHAHGSRAAFFARLADPAASRRVVYTLHGIHVDKAGSAPRRVALLAVERWLRPRTARFVTVAESDARKGAALGVLDPARTRTIHNGIPLPVPAGTPGAFCAELGITDSAPLVACIGRFHEQKDHPTLISAFAAVHAERPDAVLALVGSGPTEARVRGLVEKLRLADAIRFAPPRTAIADVYADADVVALSSLWEGLPYVVLEAMACGRPVASTDVDGIPEAVLDGVTGLLVAPRDPRALAGALLRLLGDPAAARAMGAAGRERVEREFTLERMARECLGLYEDLLGEQRRA